MNRPRGTRDFGPAETAARHAAATTLRGVFQNFGYQEVHTPTFEELELFTAKSGEGVIDELYAFQDKGGRDLCLRPELTAPVMRMLFQDHAFDPKPIKWFYYQNCFRYDRPQAGRYREFWQFGCELAGAGTPVAYAELIHLADACIGSLGLQSRELRIGHVKVLGALVDALGLSSDARGKAMRLIDKRDDEGLKALCAGENVAAGLLENLLSVMDARTLDVARQALAHEGLDELEQVLGLLDQLGVQYVLDLGIARGLDYYTGIVFEVHCPILGAQKQLLGGGGYDLSGVFDAQSLPTMGFGLGFDRLLVALEKEGVTPTEAPGIVAYFAALGQAQPQVLQWVAALRGRGVAVDMDLLGRKPGQAAKAADAAGARYLVILGDRDIEQGVVKVKDLQSGDASDVALDQLVAWLRQQG